MGRIRVLSDHIANKIAAGEVVERPSSVVKELLENSLDAGAQRIKILVEAGGKKLIHITDDGTGMVRDDAMLAFERHATSKIHDADDLLNISTLGFRGEALPSIASVSRLVLETHAAEESAGTRIEIAGGKFLKVEEAGLPLGTSILVKDLFFNIPARKKFLKTESTELSHIASLVTHYALAHPGKHIELHSAANAMLVASPVANLSERIYQVFGKETLNQLVPLAAEFDLQHLGLPEPPPWRRLEDYEPPAPGAIRLHGFVSKPEVQKLNRNSIFVFVNGRLIKDRLMQHALTDAYRNILPPTVFPVVLLFVELPAAEVDANVHPAKTEVRFRQQQVVHDFVRDSVRAALMKARPVPQFAREITAQPTASVALSPGVRGDAGVQDGGGQDGPVQGEANIFVLTSQTMPARNERFPFDGAGAGAIDIPANAALPYAHFPMEALPIPIPQEAVLSGCELQVSDEADAPFDAVPHLASLKPLGQVRDSFILAVNSEGLWIIDQHVAHERILFERVLKQRTLEPIDGQRLLIPLILDLTPGQQAIFTEICEELRRNGFEVELFGSRTIAVKTAPAGIDSPAIERILHELLDQFEREQQTENLDSARTRIAASIACHAAIKINTPLDPNKMEWLIQELAKTECPMTCPHGRPVILRYSVKDIQRAFKRI